MLVLLTPSKTMDFTTLAPDFAVPTSPVFYSEAQTIRAYIGGLSSSDLQGVMRTSPVLTEKVREMYQQSIEKPAFWVYDGDVFKGMQVKTLNAKAARFAQRHVLVPSAVYGLVRPFDAVQPYRLEMQAKVSIDGTKNLYDFWGDKLARYVASYYQDELLVLSSKEYSRAVTKHLLPDIRVITPVFLDMNNKGKVAQVPIYNKMMRGVMARWVIDQAVDSSEGVLGFAAHGYVYDAERSTADAPVFFRAEMKPLIFDT